MFMQHLEQHLFYNHLLMYGTSYIDACGLAVLCLVLVMLYFQVDVIWILVYKKGCLT